MQHLRISFAIYVSAEATKLAQFTRLKVGNLLVCYSDTKSLSALRRELENAMLLRGYWTVLIEFRGILSWCKAVWVHANTEFHFCISISEPSQYFWLQRFNSKYC